MLHTSLKLLLTSLKSLELFRPIADDIVLGDRLDKIDSICGFVLEVPFFFWELARLQSFLVCWRGSSMIDILEDDVDAVSPWVVFVRSYDRFWSLLYLPIDSRCEVMVIRRLSLRTDDDPQRSQLDAPMEDAILGARSTWLHLACVIETDGRGPRGPVKPASMIAFLNAAIDCSD